MFIAEGDLAGGFKSHQLQIRIVKEEEYKKRGE
jgi:hypothetical protein